MKKFLVLLFTGLVIIGFSTTSVFAKDVSSYELFWPISAGKVMGDPLYFVKALKENIKGLVTIGAPKKAEYAVLLSTKRLVEAEKLINDGKTVLADKTLEEGGQLLDRATVWLDQANNTKIPFVDQKTEIINRINNMKIFLPWLINKADKNKDSLSRFYEKVISLSNRL